MKVCQKTASLIFRLATTIFINYKSIILSLTLFKIFRFFGLFRLFILEKAIAMKIMNINLTHKQRKLGNNISFDINSYLNYIVLTILVKVPIILLDLNKQL